MKNLLTKTLFILSLSSAVILSGVQAVFFLPVSVKFTKVALKVGAGAIAGGLAAAVAGVVVVAGAAAVAGVVEGVVVVAEGALTGKLGTAAATVRIGTEAVGKIIVAGTTAGIVAGMVAGAVVAYFLPPRLVVAESETPVKSSNNLVVREKASPRVMKKPAAS